MKNNIIIITISFVILIVNDSYSQLKVLKYFDSTNAIVLKQEPYFGMTLDINHQTPIAIITYKTSSYIWGGYIARYNNIYYNVGFKTEEKIVDTNKNVSVIARLIQIIDKNYTSPEGLKIGDRYKDVLLKLEDKLLNIYCNNECIKLPSGWLALLSQPIKNKDNPNEEELNSVIISFIK